MIFYGSRTISRTCGQGTFNCPLCKMQRDYAHIANTRYFTLYFVPLFPIYKQGEHVQCMSCGESFGQEVLSLGPGANLGRQRYNLEDLRRAMVLLLIEARRISSEDLNRLRYWCQQIGLADTTNELLQQEIGMATQAGATFSNFASARLTGLGDEERRSLLSQAKTFLAGGLRPTPEDDLLLRRVATTLGLPPRAVDSLP